MHGYFAEVVGTYIIGKAMNQICADLESKANKSNMSISHHYSPGYVKWDISELFFKWIKQHLRIKAFYGTSENAVKTQIWIAVSVYVLVAIIKKRLKIETSLYNILQVLSLTLFEKLPLIQLLDKSNNNAMFIEDSIQLNLFDNLLGH